MSEKSEECFKSSMISMITKKIKWTEIGMYFAQREPSIITKEWKHAFQIIEQIFFLVKFFPGLSEECEKRQRKFFLFKSLPHFTFIRLHPWLIKWIHSNHDTGKCTGIHHGIEEISETIRIEIFEGEHHARTSAIIMGFCRGFESYEVQFME